MPIYSPGCIIMNKYRVERFIGAGAFGEVYQVRHTELDTFYAVKVFNSQKIILNGHLDQQVRRFRLEAQLGARLKSPRLLKVFDLGKDGENLVLAMEYAAGGNLKDQIDAARQERCPIGVEEVVKIGIQVAEGLAVLHAAGCVHRDIKPANILFDDDGDARLGDLGLAQVPGELGESATSTFQNQLGSPEYMSPEQEVYAPYLRPPSDVYSLGLVLFEALTAVNYKTQRPGTSAHSLRSGIPQWLGLLLGRMLEDDPKQRPWDGAETARLLEGQHTIKREREEAQELAEPEERAHQATSVINKSPNQNFRSVSKSQTGPGSPTSTKGLNYIFLTIAPPVPPQPYPTQFQCQGFEYITMVQLCNIAETHGLTRSKACNAFGGDKGKFPVVSERMARACMIGSSLRKFVLVAAVKRYFAEQNIHW